MVISGVSYPSYTLLSHLISIVCDSSKACSFALVRLRHFFLGFVSSHLILHGSQGFGGGDWGELVNHKTLPRVGSFPAFDHSWAPLKFLPQPFATKFVSTGDLATPGCYVTAQMQNGPHNGYAAQ